ncbi:hypothetical protein N431DRAFT_435384 [Stipitochalara longipes BDJ]|nr:hypothetical protein N431DRAFT_435384 [Stipitochalara longipes BDJ]
MSLNQRISRKPVGADGAPLSPDPQISSQDGQSQLSGRSGGIHWRASTIMVTSLLFGMLLATGHHLFYTHLNGKPVGAPEHVVMGVTRQQLNLTLGTLFAFLVHAFLSVAVTTSYTQLVWRAIKKQGTTLSTIDTIFHVVSNFWSLMFLSTWFKYPLLFLVGLTVWLIPIASVITPAALTVAVAPTIPVLSQMIRVPSVDFHSLNFANIQALRSGFVYSSPKYAVDKVVAATAAQGSILSIPARTSNASWALDFAGPSIVCTDVQGSMMSDIQQNIQAAVAIDQCTTAFGYIAWTPSYIESGGQGSEYTLYNLPFILSQNSSSYSLNDAPLGPLPMGQDNGTTSIPATFYAAIYRNMTDEVLNAEEGLTCSEHGAEGGNPLPNITVIQCELQNSSYHTSFSYINGVQTINITVDETPYNPVPPIYVLNDDSGYGPLANYSKNGSVLSYKPTVVETISYQSVMSSFGSILVGTLFNSENSDGGIVANSTSVMSTVVGETEELTWLNDYPPREPGLTATLQQAIGDPTESGGQMWNGVDVLDDFQSAVPFKAALESLFQNITVGLMSSRLLQPNISSPYAPPPTNVTLPHFQTVYIYTPSRLWIAYGLAILLTTTSVFMGLLSMLSSGIAYTNHFSTILRAARYANMETSILPEDADGKDPLPKYLATASVSFEDHERREKRGISWFSEAKSPGVSSRLLPE